jgi:Zn-dependent protease
MEHDLGTGAMWYGAFLLSTVCHEAAHAWVAFRLGDPTAHRGGQATLNPVPHIRREPVGMVVVPILSWLAGGWIFGWASAPFNPDWARAHPRRAALMALAGPGTNLALAIGAGLLIRLGFEWGVFAPPLFPSMSRLASSPDGGAMDLVAQVLSILLSLNVLLCLFNLVPLPPLDGSNAPLLLLPAAAARRYFELLRHPALRYAGILVAYVLLPHILPKVLPMVARMLYSSSAG